MSEETKSVEKKAAEQFKVMDATVSNHMVITIDGTEGRKFTFSMPFNTPLKECYDAAINAANEIARLFSEAIDRQKEKAAAEAEAEVEEKAVEETEEV